VTVARQYVLTAKEGQAGALQQALIDLAALVRPVAGCEGVEILQDVKLPERFVFVEKWASVEAHKTGGETLPKDAFAPVMATLGEKPGASYLAYLKTL
jgi:quinol monooxygenase YgiN